MKVHSTLAFLLAAFLLALMIALARTPLLLQAVGLGDVFFPFISLEIPPPPGTTTRVSVASDGSQGNGESSGPSVSADGRYVAFASTASNLVAGDTFDCWQYESCSDVFVHDRQTGEATLVSVSSAGVPGNWDSYGPSISADGRFVAFSSDASNLVPGDTNDCWQYESCSDVFVHDRQTGETTRVSVASDGTQGNDISYGASISADGRYVAFTSRANNLVPDDTNACYLHWKGGAYSDGHCPDVFIHDRQTGETTRISVASNGVQGNSVSHSGPISAEGGVVAFSSSATNLVEGDTNSDCGPYPSGNCSDVFVQDRQTGANQRVSVSSDGMQGNGESWSPAISADGRFVAFESVADNLVPGDTNDARDVFVHDRQTGETRRVSIASNGTQGNNWSYGPFISADGRYVAFTSSATNLIFRDTNNYCYDLRNCTDVFVHDRHTGQTTRVSLTNDGQPANGDSYGGTFTADGRFVAFSSYANNLVEEDANICLNVYPLGSCPDVFVRDRHPD